MTTPTWWNKRRYGLLVTANIATVASFAPIGEYAEWYSRHLGSRAATDRGLHPSPAPEVLAYHRDRWSHVQHMDEFIPFLSFHRFDADELLELATSAGMNYLVHVAKHHDGYCWWDAPFTDRTSVLSGPRRNVMAEISRACHDSDVLFGTSYSLLDWSDPRYPNPQYVTQVLHPHVLDLVGRYGSQIMWGHGHGYHDTDVWRAEELFERAQELAELQGHELAFNDHWQHSAPHFRTVEHHPPESILHTPWELHRAVGFSFGHNRAERAEHMLSTGGLVDLLTETIAKGGHLLLSVGPSVDGRISDLQQRPLREVGRWVEQHREIVHDSTPFDVWGDAQTRYVRIGTSVAAIDLSAAQETTLGGLTPYSYDVTSVVATDGGALHWEQHRGGVTVSRTDRSPGGLASVYRIDLRPAMESITLFGQETSTARPLQPLLDAANEDDIVQLDDGLYLGPATVPAGVTLRGMGWDRTTIVGGGEVIVQLGPHARLEHVYIHNSSGRGQECDSDRPDVDVSGSNAAVVSCRLDRRIGVAGDDVSVTSVIGPGVVGTAQRTTIERCTFRGTRWDTGIRLSHGSGHRVANNELLDHLCSVRLHDVSAALVTSNRCQGRWWAIHLDQCDHVSVVDNTVQHSMRAVTVTGGNGSVVFGNWISDGDSGCLVEFGATEITIIDNRIERCRVGVLVWDAPTVQVGPNAFLDLHEPESVITGPDSE